MPRGCKIEPGQRPHHAKFSASDYQKLVSNVRTAIRAHVRQAPMRLAAVASFVHYSLILLWLSDFESTHPAGNWSRLNVIEQTVPMLSSASRDENLAALTVLQFLPNEVITSYNNAPIVQLVTLISGGLITKTDLLVQAKQCAVLCKMSNAGHPYATHTLSSILCNTFEDLEARRLDEPAMIGGLHIALHIAAHCPTLLAVHGALFFSAIWRTILDPSASHMYATLLHLLYARAGQAGPDEDFSPQDLMQFYGLADILRLLRSPSLSRGSLCRVLCAILLLAQRLPGPHVVAFRDSLLQCLFELFKSKRPRLAFDLIPVLIVHLLRAATVDPPAVSDNTTNAHRWRVLRFMYRQIMNLTSCSCCFLAAFSALLIDTLRESDRAAGAGAAPTTEKRLPGRFAMKAAESRPPHTPERAFFIACAEAVLKHVLNQIRETAKARLPPRSIQALAILAQSPPLLQALGKGFRQAFDLLFTPPITSPALPIMVAIAHAAPETRRHLQIHALCVVAQGLDPAILQLNPELTSIALRALATFPWTDDVLPATVEMLLHAKAMEMLLRHPCRLLGAEAVLAMCRVLALSEGCNGASTAPHQDPALSFGHAYKEAQPWLHPCTSAGYWLLLDHFGAPLPPSSRSSPAAQPLLGSVTRDTTGTSRSLHQPSPRCNPAANLACLLRLLQLALTSWSAPTLLRLLYLHFPTAPFAAQPEVIALVAPALYHLGSFDRQGQVLDLLLRLRPQNPASIDALLHHFVAHLLRSLGVQTDALVVEMALRHLGTLLDTPRAEDLISNLKPRLGQTIAHVLLAHPHADPIAEAAIRVLDRFISIAPLETLEHLAGVLVERLRAGVVDGLRSVTLAILNGAILERPRVLATLREAVTRLQPALDTCSLHTRNQFVSLAALIDDGKGEWCQNVVQRSSQDFGRAGPPSRYDPGRPPDDHPDVPNHDKEPTLPTAPHDNNPLPPDGGAAETSAATLVVPMQMDTAGAIAGNSLRTAYRVLLAVLADPQRAVHHEEAVGALTAIWTSEDRRALLPHLDSTIAALRTLAMPRAFTPCAAAVAAAALSGLCAVVHAIEAACRPHLRGLIALVAALQHDRGVPLAVLCVALRLLEALGAEFGAELRDHAPALLAILLPILGAGRRPWGATRVACACQALAALGGALRGEEQAVLGAVCALFSPATGCLHLQVAAIAIVTLAKLAPKLDLAARTQVVVEAVLVALDAILWDARARRVATFPVLLGGPVLRLATPRAMPSPPSPACACVDHDADHGTDHGLFFTVASTLLPFGGGPLPGAGCPPTCAWLRIGHPFAEVLQVRPGDRLACMPRLLATGHCNGGADAATPPCDAAAAAAAYLGDAGWSDWPAALAAGDEHRDWARADWTGVRRVFVDTLPATTLAFAVLEDDGAATAIPDDNVVTTTTTTDEIAATVVTPDDNVGTTTTTTDEIAATVVTPDDSVGTTTTHETTRAGDVVGGGGPSCLQIPALTDSDFVNYVAHVLRILLRGARPADRGLAAAAIARLVATHGPLYPELAALEHLASAADDAATALELDRDFFHRAPPVHAFEAPPPELEPAAISERLVGVLLLVSGGSGGSEPPAMPGGRTQTWLRTLQVTAIAACPAAAIRGLAGLAARDAHVATALFAAAFAHCHHALEVAGLAGAVVAQLRAVLATAHLSAASLRALLAAVEHAELRHVGFLLPACEAARAAARAGYAALELLHRERLARCPDGCRPTASHLQAILGLEIRLGLVDEALGLLAHVDRAAAAIWYEELGRWEQALAIYEDATSGQVMGQDPGQVMGQDPDQTPDQTLEQTPVGRASATLIRNALAGPGHPKGYPANTTNGPITNLGRLRCLEALGEWSKLPVAIAKVFDPFAPSQQASSSLLVARHATLVKDWDLLEAALAAERKGCGNAPARSAGYHAVLAIARGEYAAAGHLIEEEIVHLKDALGGMESAGWAHQSLKLQGLFDLAQANAALVAGARPEAIARLQTAWNRRLQMRPDPVDWQTNLLFRSLLVDPRDDLDIWLSYLRLADDHGMRCLALNTLAWLRKCVVKDAAMLGRSGAAQYPTRPLEPVLARFHLENIRIAIAPANPRRGLAQIVALQPRIPPNERGLRARAAALEGGLREAQGMKIATLRAAARAYRTAATAALATSAHGAAARRALARVYTHLACADRGPRAEYYAQQAVECLMAVVQAFAADPGAPVSLLDMLKVLNICCGDIQVYDMTPSNVFKAETRGMTVEAESTSMFKMDMVEPTMEVEPINMFKVDTLKMDTLKMDTLKTDTLKTNTLKTDTLKTNTLKTDTLKMSTLKTDTLKTNTLKTNTLKTDTLKTSTLKTNPIKTNTLEASNPINISKPAANYRTRSATDYIPRPTVSYRIRSATDCAHPTVNTALQSFVDHVPTNMTLQSSMDHTPTTLQPMDHVPTPLQPMDHVPTPLQPMDHVPTPLQPSTDPTPTTPRTRDPPLWRPHRTLSDVLISWLNILGTPVWIPLIPQLISRALHPSAIRPALICVLQAIAADAPQHLVSVVGLLDLQRGTFPHVGDLLEPLIRRLQERHARHLKEAFAVRDELVGVSELWHERWHAILRTAAAQLAANGDPTAVLAFETTAAAGPPAPPDDRRLQASIRKQVAQAAAWLRGHGGGAALNKTRSLNLLENAVLRLRRVCESPTLRLRVLAPRLHTMRDLALAVFGRDAPAIHRFRDRVRIIFSKRRPRRLALIGTDGRTYHFLLKAGEDLQQDQRVMQIAELVNAMLEHAPGQTLAAPVVTYHVTPVAPMTALLSWVPHCDTLGVLIRGHRLAKGVPLNLELQHLAAIANAARYDLLTRDQKLEAYADAVRCAPPPLELRECLWLGSDDAAHWVRRRTHYIGTLAVMSIFGHALAIGDRHLDNLLLSRTSGKVAHIDVGDCFLDDEDDVPFRLTRMLVAALDPSGPHGAFRIVAQRTLAIMADNADAVYHAVAALVLDPLVRPRVRHKHPDDILRRLRRVLAGNEAYVRGLVDRATDPRVVARAYLGWMPFW